MATDDPSCTVPDDRCFSPFNRVIATSAEGSFRGGPTRAERRVRPPSRLLGCESRAEELKASFAEWSVFRQRLEEHRAPVVRVELAELERRLLL